MPGAETCRGPADAYDRLMGRYGRPLAAAFLDAAGIRAGMRALDVGSRSRTTPSTRPSPSSS